MKKQSCLKHLAVLSASGLTALTLLAGCGTPAVNVPATDSVSGSSAVSGDNAGVESVSSNAGNTSADATSTDNMVGKWEMIYSLYHGEYGTEGDVYDDCTMTTDPYSPSSIMYVHKDGDKYIADYKYESFEEHYRLGGNEMIYLAEPAYEGCENSEWCMVFANPFEDEYESKRYTMLPDGKLIGATTYSYGEKGTEDYGIYRTVDVYMRQDDPAMAEPDELRYFDTVTVSTVEELVNNLKDNRKIILKEGTYNFSLLDDSKVDNPYFLDASHANSYVTYTINNVHNLGLMAEDGAEVLLCTNVAYDPVLYFQGCGNIALKGVTCGHNVEPGYCSGSVLSFTDVAGVDIDDSKLFGCGTYGIEASNCEFMTIDNTEIYECTYGLVDLRNVNSAYFTDCTLRDSKDMSMINAHDSYDISFSQCTFKNNQIDESYDFCYFADLSEYSDLSFYSCTFENNQYKIFSNEKVVMSDCTINDNGTPDMSNVEAPYSEEADSGSITADELKTAFEAGTGRQEEIDALYKNANLDQAAMNELAYEEYEMWNGLMTNLFIYLENTLDADAMTALNTEQETWSKERDAAVKKAADEFKGGSMEPLMEYGTNASKIRERVTKLMETYVK